MAEEKEYLSLADLEGLQDEVLEGFDANADANALPPPIQPGKYLLKVKHQAGEESKFWAPKKTKPNEKKGTTGGVPYFSTDLWCEVVENPANPKEFHGRRIPANNVMTLVMNNGTTGAQAVIQALGKGPELANGPQTASRQCVMLSKLLMSEPLIGAEVDWEASWYSEGEGDKHPRKRGAKNFKKDAEGKYIPQLEVEGDEAEVRLFIRRWMTVAELTGGAAALHGVKNSETKESASAPQGKPAPAPKAKVR